MVECLDVSLIGIEVFDTIAAVEDDHFGFADHVRNHRFHIRKIHRDGGCIDRCDLLLHLPVPRQAQVAELPHTVIFYDNALRMILFFQLDHLFRSKIRLFLDGFHDRLAAL